MQRQDLERMSTSELHDRAVDLARARVDVGFLWRLVKAIPVAQAAGGNLDEAEADVASLTSLIADTLNAGEGEVGEALRPLYIDYLAHHG